jgi:hypothetical protein
MRNEGESNAGAGGKTASRSTTIMISPLMSKVKMEKCAKCSKLHSSEQKAQLLQCLFNGRRSQARGSIIPGDGASLDCEETVPNPRESHSTMRHGFAGRRLQHVSRIFSNPIGSFGAHEQLLEGEEWPGTGGAVVRHPAPRELATRVRLPRAAGSEPLELGAARLGRDVARRHTGDEAHHGGHSPNLRRSKETLLSRPANSGLAIVLRVDRCVAPGRRIECVRMAIASMDESRRPVFVASWLLDGRASGRVDGAGDICTGPDLSNCATQRDDVEFRFAWSDGSDDSVVEHQFAVWNLRSAHEVWTCLRRACCGDRIDGVDGVLCDDRLCGCGLERRRRSMISGQGLVKRALTFGGNTFRGNPRDT